MKAEKTFDTANPQDLQTHFGTYGSRTRDAIAREGGGYRFWLNAVAGLNQTGVYSYFTLSGDCEVTFVYDLLNLQPPRMGYGSGVGMALDAGEKVGRAEIKRLVKAEGEMGYGFQTLVPGSGGKMQEESRFVAAPAKLRSARIGLRRIKKEVIFLAAKGPDAELEEIDRLPFTDQTIRAVRFFVDQGGSPTTVGARVREMKMRAEEITGGVPEKEKYGSYWWLLWIVLPAAGCVLFWWWRARTQAEDEPQMTPSRKPRWKKP
jgi:hypothetical protein